MNARFRLAAIVLLSCGATASAADFDLRDGVVENLDGAQSLQLTDDGITATVSAVAGILNQEAGGFGVTSGTDNDGDFLFDNADAITIEFDQNVEWDSLTVSVHAEGQLGSIRFDGNDPIFFSGPGVKTVGQGTIVESAGGVVTIQTADTSGFSLDSFSVTAIGGPVDSDNDGVPDGDDVAPNDEFQCADEDGDGCDDCAVLGIQNPDQDGTDSDGDGLCDAGDDDVDDDGVPNGDDPQDDDPFSCGDSEGDGCDDCRFSGGPPDPQNDGVDLNNNGICDVREGLPDVIVFDMLSPIVADLDDEQIFSLQVGPLVATLRSPAHFLFQDDGTFGAGPGFFDPPDDALVNGEETIEISFNYDVRWQWMELSQVNAGDCASLSIAGMAFEPCGSGATVGGGDTVIMRVTTPFSRVAIGPVGDAKFSLDRFAAVPMIAESIIDLQLDVGFPDRVGPTDEPLTINDELVLKFRLANIGPSDADQVQVQTSIPDSLMILEATPPAGTTYDIVSGIWNVPHLDTEFRIGGATLPALSMRVRILPGSGESIGYTAEVLSALQADEDSTPGNGSIDEDDDASQTIDIARSGEGEAQVNPLLAALVFLFTCGNVGGFAPVGTMFGIVLIKRRLRTIRRRPRGWSQPVSSN